MTNEFQHYVGCKHNDPENCGACALTDQRQERPNYAGWPLAYLENHRSIPAKWRQAFKDELARTDNSAYVANLREKMKKHGFHFTDSKPLGIDDRHLLDGVSETAATIKTVRRPYPGWRTMTAAQRRNARMERIFEDAKARGDWPAGSAA